MNLNQGSGATSTPQTILVMQNDEQTRNQNNSPFAWVDTNGGQSPSPIWKCQKILVLFFLVTLTIAAVVLTVTFTLSESSDNAKPEEWMAEEFPGKGIEPIVDPTNPRVDNFSYEGVDRMLTWKTSRDPNSSLKLPEFGKITEQITDITDKLIKPDVVSDEYHKNLFKEAEREVANRLNGIRS
ncbi:uncharacterized protein BXIN_0609 [Babesia sp. Xinjiang]|uniref:uncharacterized protein n=1 Tax=Babesia sp. Xinjiang TaxID=462227 RepID=UPI000A244B0D|nr:uncharacterized protein BXIN_0609 [Babesia sp. Xinjiang]ORM41788.1 hypothetical protein BXIN_0609 [Babesia sp. Xinjiang]